MSLLIAACAAGLALGQSGWGENDGSLGTFPYDPVELAESGREVVGAESIAVNRYGYRYRFVSADGRLRFMSDPERFEIQLGGGCGSMGPLSGRGDLRRFAVHDGRIYVFASDGCKARFLSMPEKLVDRDDPKPSFDRSPAEAGKKLLEKLAAWCGGAERIDAAEWYREVVEQVVASGGQNYDNKRVFAVRHPDGIFRSDAWNKDVWTMTAERNDGTFRRPDGTVQPMNPVQARALERIRDHRLFWILKARKHADFVAGRDADDGGQARLRVWFGGSASTIRLDPDSGKPASIEFVGRGPGAMVGQVKLEFTEFAQAGGLRLPSAWTGTFDGKPSEAVALKGAKIFLDGDGVKLAPPQKG